MEAFRINDPGPGRISDNAVIERVINGEKELFEILMRRHNQKVFRIIRGYIREEEEIEDVMQESYMKAYDQLHKFEGRSAFSTWLIRIAINEALNRIRHKGRLVSFNFGSMQDENEREMFRDFNPSTPESKAIYNEMKKILEVSIDKLPDKYRAVYIMREVEGMKNEEISSCLNITESNVKVRLHRAKSLIRENIVQLSSVHDVFEFGGKRCDRIVDYVMSRVVNG